MPQRLLSLPLFFHISIIATLFFLAVLSIPEQTTEGSEQRCSFCSESFINGPHFSSSCFSALIAHWFMDTVLASFCHNCLNSAAWLNSWESVIQPTNFTHLLILPFSVFPPYTHTRLVKCLFLMLCRQSGTLSCMKSGRPTPSHPSNHHLKLFQQSYWSCVCWEKGGGRGWRGREREGREKELVVYSKVWELFFYTYFVSCNGPCALKEKWHRKEHIIISYCINLAVKLWSCDPEICDFPHPNFSMTSLQWQTLSSVFLTSTLCPNVRLFILMPFCW